MGWFGPPHSIVVLLAVAIVAAVCGFTASTVLRTNRRRTRSVFLVGALCGLVAGATLHRRLKIAALRAVLRWRTALTLDRSSLAIPLRAVRSQRLARRVRHH